MSSGVVGSGSEIWTPDDFNYSRSNVIAESWLANRFKSNWTEDKVKECLSLVRGSKRQIIDRCLSDIGGFDASRATQTKAGLTASGSLKRKASRVRHSVSTPVLSLHAPAPMQPSIKEEDSDDEIQIIDEDEFLHKRPRTTERSTFSLGTKRSTASLGASSEGTSEQVLVNEHGERFAKKGDHRHFFNTARKQAFDKKHYR